MRKISKIMLAQPMRLALTIILAFYFHHFIPLTGKQIFLAISLSLKEILMLMIPLIIFSSVYGAFSKIRGHAVLFAGLLLTCIVLSNFFSVSLAGVFSYFLVFNGDPSLHSVKDIIALEPFWTFKIPKIVSNNIVLLFSLIFACINKPIINNTVGKAAKVTTKIVDIFLKKLFIPALPIFIFGFLVKLLTDDIISDVVAVNPKAFIFMIISLWTYFLFIFMTAVIFYKKEPMEIIRNILSPAITAFTSMSSAAALPFSITAAENNTNNKNVSDVVMPATVNIHMIGDSICIPILAMIMIMAFGQPIPTLSGYLVFAATFTITKFSGAAVPGGSILVMLPVLESCLGFNPEMSALITICYMLLDPITTSGNVIGNNLFVMHFNKLYGFLTRKTAK
jgi:Na+/H+-dicarboxylate symporter